MRRHLVCSWRGVSAGRALADELIHAVGVPCVRLHCGWPAICCLDICEAEWETKEDLVNEVFLEGLGSIQAVELTQPRTDRFQCVYY